MARSNPNKDIVLSDPIGTLKKVSDISLLGGSGVFLAVCYAVYKMNVGGPRHLWHIQNSLLLAGVISATVLAVAGAITKAYDARLRVQLALELLATKGTTDAEDAKDKPVTARVIDMTKPGHLISFVIQPPDPGNPQQ